MRYLYESDVLIIYILFNNAMFTQIKYEMNLSAFVSIVASLVIGGSANLCIIFLYLIYFLTREISLVL